MSLNKIEKYSIITVILLILIAICCNLTKITRYIKIHTTSEKKIDFSSAYPIAMQDMPKNISEISKKYKAFSEIYDSKELLLIYGYEPLSVDEKNNRIFHKQINDLLKEKKLNIKVLAYKNWQEVLNAVQIENGRNPSACTLYSDEEKDLKTIIETTANCFMNSCVIDVKNQKYAVIAKNPAFVIATLEDYLGKQP